MKMTQLVVLLYWIQVISGSFFLLAVLAKKLHFFPSVAEEVAPIAIILGLVSCSAILFQPEILAAPKNYHIMSLTLSFNAGSAYLLFCSKKS